MFLDRRAPVSLAVVLLFVLVPLEARGGAAEGERQVGQDWDGMPPWGESVSRKSWTWNLVDERGIALGGGGLEEDDVLDLKERGFDAVLNVRAEYDDEEPWVRGAGMSYRYIPIGYAEEDIISVAELEEGIAFIRESLDEGRFIYVHCTGGWHRSASFIAAFYMKENGWTFEQAWKHLAKARPGIESRYAESMLLYEQHLLGGEKVTVDLWTTREDVQIGESMQVEAYVRDGANRPVEGARLVFAADHSAQHAEAVSDAEGRATFTYTVEKGWLQYVHVWAFVEGHIPGYDRNDFWVREDRGRTPTLVEVGGWEAPVDPGARVQLEVTVREEQRQVANALLTLTSDCGQLFRDYSGWDGRETITFDAPLAEGTYTFQLRANRFAAEPLTETFELVVGQGGTTPTCPSAPAPVEEEPPAAEPDGEPLGPMPFEGVEETVEEAVDAAKGFPLWGKTLGFAALAGALVLGVRQWRRA